MDAFQHRAVGGRQLHVSVVTSGFRATAAPFSALMETTLKQLDRQHRLLGQHWPELSEIELTQPLAPGRWSRKEILGHLIDSAANNYRRFVLAQFGPWPYVIQPYDQDQWVQCGSYLNVPGTELFTLWNACNKQLKRLIATIPAAALARECQTPYGTSVTLEWLIKDYVLHLEHHVQQILHG